MPDTAALSSAHTTIAVLSSALPTLVLALPFAALLVLVVLLFRPIKRQAKPLEKARVEAAPIKAVQPSLSLAAVSEPLQQSPKEATPPAVEPQSSEGEQVSEDDMFRHIGPVPDPKTPDELHEEVTLAERAGNHALLARLCLELAQADPAATVVPELLRKCVRAAMRSKNFAIHAAARLELAERARLAGDLTTACEHWQIARGLFFDMNDRDLHKTAETLMLRHGCPTDWVLTDF